MSARMRHLRFPSGLVSVFSLADLEPHSWPAARLIMLPP